ncbi:MAG: type II secretion system protein [Lachnospirales bacterium]
MKQRNQNIKKKYGFTLVEVIVVIAILLILSSLLVPRYTKYVEDARIAKMQTASDALQSSISDSIQMYIMDGNKLMEPQSDGTYPTDIKSITNKTNPSTEPKGLIDLVNSMIPSNISVVSTGDVVEVSQKNTPTDVTVSFKYTPDEDEETWGYAFLYNHNSLVGIATFNDGKASVNGSELEPISEVGPIVIDK